jgi:hypothetical protein
VRRWREPAAIAAEIERIRLLRLDALRRHWRLVFGSVTVASILNIRMASNGFRPALLFLSSSGGGRSR